MRDSADSSATYIERSIASAQRRLRGRQSRRMFWQSMLGLLIFVDIFAVARPAADLSLRWCALAGIFPLIWAVRHWLSPVAAATAAHFLDDCRRLEQSVISSYRLLGDRAGSNFRDILLRDTARRLSQAGEARLGPVIPRRMRQAIIVLTLGAIFLCFLPYSSTTRADREATPDIRNAAAFAVEDIARKLEQEGERKLSAQFAQTGAEWHREETAAAEMLQHIEKLERLTGEEIDALRRLLPHALESGVNFAGLALSPPIRKALAEAISQFSREHSLEEGLPLAKAVEKGQKSEVSRRAESLRQEISRRASALQRSLLSLRQLSQELGTASGADSARLPGQGNLLTSAGASLYGESDPGMKSDRAPQAFAGPRREDPAKSYLPNPWWPARYHPVVETYFTEK